MMKTLRILILIVVLIFCAGFSQAIDKSEGPVFPDLLTAKFLEDEEFDKFDEENESLISDPFEPMNRVFFEFNDKMYEWVLKPFTDGYIWFVPKEIRISFNNFFSNLAMPVRLLNSLLQANFEDAGIILSRFAINTTLGIYGLADVASVEFDIQPKRADFGQTLGKWGVGEGVYFCWPLLGPSSVRGSVGLVVDAYTHPIPYFQEDNFLGLAYYTSYKLNTLSLNRNLYEDLKRFSLDPYIASKIAYYEYRKAMVGRE